MPKYKQPYSIYKRGKYYYYRTYDNKGLRTCGKSTGCTNKSAARKYCDELFLRGLLYHEEIRFKKYAEHFFDDDSIYVKDRYKEFASNTLKNYRSVLSTKIMPFFKDYNLSEINYSLLKQFRIELINKYKSGTVKQIMIVLKIIIDSAFRDQYIKTNPFIYLDKLNATDESRDGFTLKEINYMYNNPVEPRVKDFVIIYSLMGLRLGEAFAIFDDCIIKQDNFYYVLIKRQFTNGEIKNVKYDSVRQIPIIPELLEYVKMEHSETDHNMLPANIRVYKSIFDDGDKRGLCIHSMRHFFITNAKAYGVPDIKVEYLAGHKIPGVKGIYTNFKAADCLEILEWQKKTLEEIKRASADE